jgi:integrase
MSFLTKHFGSEQVRNFTPASLVFVRRKLEVYGYVRDKINYYIQLIKQAFEQGVVYWGVPPTVYHALLAVKSLKEGKTMARESEPFKPVADEIVEQTLPHLHPVVGDMVMVQRHSCMRPQDICNVRLCDIDQSGDVWVYRPYTHKNKTRGKNLEKMIGRRAQEILRPYLEKRKDTPEKFLFSPLDGGDKASRRGRDFFSRDRYDREVAKGVKLAGVERWTAQQIRVTSTREAREKFGLEFAQSFAGHSNSSTTERHYAPVSCAKAIEVAREIG